MSLSKPLKILTTKPDDNLFLQNNNDSTYIKIPKSVYSTIIKIDKLPGGINHIFIDVLATAINKRRLEMIVKSQNNPNSSFRKLISTFNKEVCHFALSEKEENELLSFFTNCPPGYDATKLIRAHSELLPVIT